MALMRDYLHMAPVSHGTSACAISAFAPPTTNKIGAMGAMVPAYFSMTRRDRFSTTSSRLLFAEVTTFQRLSV